MLFKPKKYALLLAVPVLAVSALANEDGARLLRPFHGFSTVGMAPVFDLFQAEVQGRLLLDRAGRKIGISGREAWLDVFCFCGEDQLAPESGRRGLFMQEKARYYRERGAEEWRAGTKDSMQKMADSARFPIVDRKTWSTRYFEHMEVAFKPRICVSKGLSILQTYLVLVHELTHLAETDPFATLDLHAFGPETKERAFYHAQLAMPGGELSAYLAQIQAYRDLKKRYRFRGETVLEPFLDRNGRLLVRERGSFLGHLLDQANYRAELDRYLADQVVFQYNTAFAWWEYIDRLMADIRERLGEIDRDIGIVEKALAEAKKANHAVEGRRLSGLLTDLERIRLQKRQQVATLDRERADYASIMDRIDARYPRPE